jgi:hypothetical protein
LREINMRVNAALPVTPGEDAAPEERNQIAAARNDGRHGDSDIAAASAAYEDKLENALRTSAAEAPAQEGAYIQEALLRSKADIYVAHDPPLVVLRLTKRNPEVVQALLEAPTLQGALNCVESAGCDFMPDWANNAVMLAPITKEWAMENDLELREYHIVVAKQDQVAVEETLAAIPKRRRPRVHQADLGRMRVPGNQHEVGVEPGTQDGSMVQAETDNHEVDVWDGAWRVERTFLHWPDASSVSSRTGQSEPWGGMAQAETRRLGRLPNEHAS